jgi:phage baseplate assembly protein W
MTSEGNHLSYPFRIDRSGRTAQVRTPEEHVRDEIVQLLLTAPGERAFMPEFGAGVRRLIFEGSDAITAGVAKAVIIQSINDWLGHRAVVENLSVEAVNETVEIEIAYRISGREDTRILRFRRGGD